MKRRECAEVSAFSRLACPAALVKDDTLEPPKSTAANGRADWPHALPLAAIHPARRKPAPGDQLVRQEGIGIERVEVERAHDLTGTILNLARIQDELRITMPGGRVLPAPLATWVSVARTQECLASVDQAGIGKSALGSHIEQHLRRLTRMLARIFIAARRRRHEATQYIRLLLDLARPRNQGRGIVIGNTIAGHREDIQLHPLALSLNNLPAFKDPDEVNAARLQGLHTIDIQGDAAKDPLATVVL